MPANINVIDLLNGKGTYTVTDGQQQNESIINVTMNTDQRMITEPLIMFKDQNGLQYDINHNIEITDLQNITITLSTGPDEGPIDVYLYDGRSNFYHPAIYVDQGEIESFEYYPQTDEYFRIDNSIATQYELKIKPQAGYTFNRIEAAYYNSITGTGTYQTYTESDSQIRIEGDYYIFQIDNGDRVHKVYLDEDTSTPTDPQTEYDLTINIIGEGTINASNGSYDQGTALNFLPIPKPGWRFKEWTGDLVSVTKNENITMDSNKTITLTFEKIVEVNTSGNGSIEFDPPLDNYQPGDTVNMVITPEPGWKIENINVIDSGT